MIAEMKKYDAEFGVETEFETAGYFADDIQVVAHEHVRLTRWDRTLGGKAVHIFEFKDGRISNRSSAASRQRIGRKGALSREYGC